jgi:hypothetical protein
MALGKHLFSFRTQQLSPAAAIILRKRETSTMPNYRIAPGNTGGFLVAIKFGIVLVSIFLGRS